MFSQIKKVNDIKYIHALKDINIEIKDGERVGLIGPNGSGKTTFLKTISGIYKPSTGIVESAYDIYTMLDVGMGLSGDATGRENIDLMGLVRGLSREEIDSKRENIIKYIFKFASISGINNWFRRDIVSIIWLWFFW